MSEPVLCDCILAIVFNNKPNTNLLPSATDKANNTKGGTGKKEDPKKKAVTVDHWVECPLN